MIPVDVAQVGRAADEADHRADHHDDQSSQQRVVHEGYPVEKEDRTLRDGGGLIERTRVQAALGRAGKRRVRETMIDHVPLRADNNPHHQHHRDQAAGHRALGRRPRYQHPQGEQAEHGAGGDAGYSQGQLEDVAEAVHEEHHADAQEAQDHHRHLSRMNERKHQLRENKASSRSQQDKKVLKHTLLKQRKQSGE